MSPRRRARARRGQIDRLARALVQGGFLALLLYPFVPAFYKRITNQPGPTLTSWLLPWDPLLLAGRLLHGNWDALVIGAPLLTLALTLIFGRAFCGWVCPVGTVLDAVQGVVFWRRQRGARRHAPPAQGLARLFPSDHNSPARYYVLGAVLVGGIVSLQLLAALDPLIVIHRSVTALAADGLALARPGFTLYLSVSLVLLALLALEIWQPRFWCRHLCPLGALMSLGARGSLLTRRVGAGCNDCGQCRRICPMAAIPTEGRQTDYAACHQCLACEAVCPRGAIAFGFGVENGGTERTVAVNDQPPTVVEFGSGARVEGRDAERTVAVIEQPLGAEAAGLKTQSPTGLSETRTADSVAPGASSSQPDPFRVGRRAQIPMSRKQFVGGVAAGAAGLAVAALPSAARPGPVIRPPGALPEADFLRACILCQECVRVCPTGGLKPLSALAGAAVGTPHLVPRQGSCSLNPSCPHLCAQVCPAGAIRRIAPSQFKIGLARVDHALCLAWDQGSKCLVCVEACLVEAAMPYHGRVTVDPNKCTGCGRCEQACPVVESAIRVYPLTKDSSRNNFPFYGIGLRGRLAA